MKNLFKVALIATGIFAVGQTYAGTAPVDSLGHKIGHAAKKVGHKTSEVAAKGAAAVTDKKFDGKVGPGGQTIYIDKDSHYFYVNKKGHRVFLKKSELRDK